MPTSLPVALPTWSKTKTTSKAGFDKAWSTLDKLGAPVNKLSNKIGSEAFWPTTLDKESDKAARILRSFCKDGFYGDVDHNEGYTRDPATSIKGKQRVVKKIPAEVIRKAKGLAIFTTMRTGLWVSGAGGSGILVGRTETGEWSPPSGILLHTAGLGFLVGVDIYDCVVVINTEKALDAFTKIRCTLGGEISAVTGPVGIGGVLETELHKRQAPVWTYLKSRGFYAGVQVDGTVIIERSDENEKFYGQRIGVGDILKGKVRHPPYEIRTLMATIKAAQGDNDVDEKLLPSSEPTPGDLQVEIPDENAKGFGLPAVDDPDPFGVRALEEHGLEIREAGTRSRPSSDAFAYKPSPTSPIFGTFNRKSVDGVSRSNSRRDSKMSVASVDHGTQTPDIVADTIEEVPRSASAKSHSQSPLTKTSENLDGVLDGEEESQEDHEHDHDHVHVGDEEAVDVHKAESADVKGVITAQATSSPIVARGARMVTIPKRIPPALPPRNPFRSHGNGPVVVDGKSTSVDATEGEETRSSTETAIPVTNDWDEKNDFIEPQAMNEVQLTSVEESSTPLTQNHAESGIGNKEPQETTTAGPKPESENQAHTPSHLSTFMTQMRANTEDDDEDEEDDYKTENKIQNPSSKSNPNPKPESESETETETHTTPTELNEKIHTNDKTQDQEKVSDNEKALSINNPLSSPDPERDGDEFHSLPPTPVERPGDGIDDFS
ncbi:hypothetical protein MMC09_005303 [Bachmanniomyces sp. S44760]|nr:hypothetical protein [Bachmanniomyces sp. S44760]